MSAASPSSCRYAAAHKVFCPFVTTIRRVVYSRICTYFIFLFFVITTVKKLLFFRIHYSAIGRFSRGFIITALTSKRHFGRGPWFDIISLHVTSLWFRARYGESKNVVSSRVHSHSFANHLWILRGDILNRGK